MHHSIVRLAVAGSLCGVFAGCASTGTPTPDDPPQGDRIVLTQGGTVASAPGQGYMASHTPQVYHATDYYTGIRVRINASASSILDTLSGVYHDLGIPITTRMSTTGQIGNRGYKVPGHSLKNILLSRIVECGQGSIGGRRADVDEIRLNVISTIKPATDSGSVVNTYVAAFARAFASSNDPTQCASAGVLEQMINDRLIKAFGGSAIN
jgi:hypothetical protein